MYYPLFKGKPTSNQLDPERRHARIYTYIRYVYMYIYIRAGFLSGWTFCSKCSILSHTKTTLSCTNLIETQVRRGEAQVDRLTLFTDGVVVGCVIQRLFTQAKDIHGSSTKNGICYKKFSFNAKHYGVLSLF